MIISLFFLNVYEIKQKKFKKYFVHYLLNFFIILNLLRTIPPIAPAAIATAIIMTEYIFNAKPLPVKLDKRYIASIYTKPIIPPIY